MRKNFENFIFILIGTTGGNEIGDIIFINKAIKRDKGVYSQSGFIKKEDTIENIKYFSLENNISKNILIIFLLMVKHILQILYLIYLIK